MKTPASMNNTAAASCATANTSTWVSSGSARPAMLSLRCRLTITAMAYAVASARNALPWYAAAITWFSRKRAQASAVSVAHATRETVSITRSIAGTIAWPWKPGRVTRTVDATPTAMVRTSSRSSLAPSLNGAANRAPRKRDPASAVTVVPGQPEPKARDPRRSGTRGRGRPRVRALLRRVKRHSDSPMP